MKRQSHRIGVRKIALPDHVIELKLVPIPPKPDRIGMGGERLRGWYVYDVVAPDGEVLVSHSRQPEFDVARVLQGRGMSGWAALVDGVTGTHRTSVNIEKAAQLTVNDNRYTTGIQKYYPKGGKGDEGES